MRIEDEIQSKFKSDHHKLIVNLHLTYMRLTESFHALLKDYNITATQYNVLRILRGQKQVPVSIGLIKDRMIERNSDISRIIDRLLKKNLIERKENVLDRRQRDIIINQNGLDLLVLIEKTEDEFIESMAHITLDEIQLMNDLLDKLRSKTA